MKRRVLSCDLNVLKCDNARICGGNLLQRFAAVVEKIILPSCLVLVVHDSIVRVCE